jgi:hypothetical protein
LLSSSENENDEFFRLNTFVTIDSWLFDVFREKFDSSFFFVGDIKSMCSFSSDFSLNRLDAAFIFLVDDEEEQGDKRFRLFVFLDVLDELDEEAVEALVAVTAVAAALAAAADAE